MKTCVDCGDAPVNHTIEWISSCAQKALTPRTIVFEGLGARVKRSLSPFLYGTLAPLLMRVLVALRLARFAERPDEKTSRRARVMWEEALHRRIPITEFRLFGVGRECFLVTYGGRHKTFLDLPRPGDVDSPGLLWMDDKQILCDRLSASGVPTARGAVVTTEREARELFAKLRPPVVVKPEMGSRSRHTTTHVETIDELITAFRKAKVLCPWVIIEEEEVGFVYRGTVIGGKLIAVLRREPPLVIGDGEHTVSELVAKENTNPLRAKSPFHPIAIDDEARAELARQHLSLTSVPTKGQMVTLSQKATRGIGGGTTDVTDLIHSDNRTMLEAAARVIGDPLIGFDFIIPQIERSWREQERCGIIESNSMPFIDLHHYPLVGEPRNVAGALWDLVYPSSRVS